jgi:inhibitor of cysteine peptidase
MGNPIPEAVNVTEANNGSQATMKLEQELVVSLGSNPSTGYRWQVDDVDESVLQQVGMAQYTPNEPGSSPIPGQAGQETLRFQAAGAGQTWLVLVYRRPWEGDADEDKTFKLQVIVK